jgi:hypothetical protein
MTVLLKFISKNDPMREKIPSDCLGTTELMNLFPGSPNRRHQMVKRALAQGDLIHLRRGLYCLGERHRTGPINLFSIAQKIYGPSAVSLESALSYHGWIPEAVYTTTSVSAQRSREFKTPLGIFSYRKIPISALYTAVDIISSGSNVFFMARPWKAIADYVFVYKKDWITLDPLRESLRIDAMLLKDSDLVELKEIEAAYASRRVSRFFKGVLRELTENIKRTL